MEYEIKLRSHFRLGFSELWDYRELFFFFTWRDIQVKYKQTLLGFLWAVLQPLLMMFVFTIFFGKVLNSPSEGLPYPVFVLSGLILWGLFSNGLLTASNSMVTNANIIKKIYFPRMIIPFSAILSALFDFIMALIVYCGILIYYQPHIDWASLIYCIPLALMLSVFAALGPGLLLCALNVKYRDFRYVVPFLIQLLLFLTPVIYPISLLKFDAAKYILSFNPMSAPIALFRAPLLSTSPDWELISISILSNILLLITGIIYFRKTETFFADQA
jgi:lipopolysaccharide transport system permease protein